MTENSRYNALGVSADKNEVHQAIRNLDKGLYPLAFCKVLPDWVGHDVDFVNLIHADTAGTKTSLAYLYWNETGDDSVWAGIAQDALVMNLDDLACVGSIQDIVISSTIGRNKHLIPGAVIERIIEGTQAFISQMEEYGIRIHSGGGETADVGDIVRSIDVGITAFSRMHKKDLLINNIKAGDKIVAFASFGQAVYENAYNSGIGSNGLTAARHDLLNKTYLAVESSYSPQTNPDQLYTGPFRMTDHWKCGDEEYEIGRLLLSPTRTYLPVLVQLFKELKTGINGVIHCTGGAQTKVKKFIEKGCVVKNNLFPLPPMFELLRQYSLCTPKELFQVYNMGHRLELYVQSEAANEIIEIARNFNVDARVIGHVESAPVPGVRIQSSLGEFVYE